MSGLSDELRPLKNTSVEELQAKADETDYLSPRELAKLLGKQPQQIYTAIRKGTFQTEKCKCGRTIICVSKAKAKIEQRQRELGKLFDKEGE